MAFDGEWIKGQLIIFLGHYILLKDPIKYNFSVFNGIFLLVLITGLGRMKGQLIFFFVVKLAFFFFLIVKVQLT